MDQGRVDIVAWLRRAVPLWVVWPLFAAPVAILAVIHSYAETLDAFPYVGSSTVYDENGTIVSSGSSDALPWLLRAAGILVLPGSDVAAPAVALVAVVLAVGVLVVHRTPGGSGWHRASAICGALSSLLLVTIGALPIVLLPALLAAMTEDAPQSISQAFFLQGLELTPVALVAAVTFLVCLRLVWGRVPVVGSADDGAPDLPGSVPQTDADPAVPAAPAAPAAPAVAPAAPSVGSWPAAEAVDSRGWDVRVELPPDFRAPQPGASAYERPAPARPSDHADEADPDAAYRRPQPTN